MNKKELQAQRAKQEDAILNKVLWWIVGSVVLEFLLLLLNKFYANYTVAQVETALALREVFKRLAIILPICFVVLLVWAILAQKSKKLPRLSATLAGIALVLSVCAVVIRVFDNSGLHFLYAAVPVIAVLALIYYLYPREFFCSAFLGTLGILGVKMIPYKASSAVIGYGYLLVLAVVVVAALVFFRMLQKKQGMLELRGKNVEFFAKNTNYAMLYVTCGVVAAVALVTVLLGSMALLYGLLVAWLLILAVYYTVRIM